MNDVHGTSMTIETLRQICLGFPEATEDIKWGQELVFSIGGKMFCAVNIEPPHQMAFKTTPDDFGALIERPGMKPAPYLARATWVMEEQLGEVLDRPELERLVRQAYDLVRAKVPKSRLAGAARVRKQNTRAKRSTAGRRSRAVPAGARRRRR